jgi:hypothetical protein
MPRRNSPPRFDPHSHDAMFATIITRLDKQDDDTEQRHLENKEVLEGILEQTSATNGRVKKLEHWRIYHKGYTAAIAMVVSAFGWLASWLLWKFFVHS